MTHFDKAYNVYHMLEVYDNDIDYISEPISSINLNNISKGYYCETINKILLITMSNKIYILNPKTLKTVIEKELNKFYNKFIEDTNTSSTTNEDVLNINTSNDINSISEIENTVYKLQELISTDIEIISLAEFNSHYLETFNRNTNSIYNLEDNGLEITNGLIETKLYTQPTKYIVINYLTRGTLVSKQITDNSYFKIRDIKLDITEDFTNSVLCSYCGTSSSNEFHKTICPILMNHI